MRKLFSILLVLFPAFVFAQWTQLGPDIDGLAPGDRNGESHRLNASGMTVVVGAPYKSINSDREGQVRVLDWDGTNWVQRGNALDGIGFRDLFGQSVDINSDGNVIVVGAPESLDTIVPSPAGYAQVYAWNGSSWVQRGATISGINNGDNCGADVAINGDGTIVAVSSTSFSGINMWSGQVRVFQWDGNAWNLLGQGIEGEAAQDFSGVSISLNHAGDIVAIGAQGNDANGNSSGHCRVYEWGGSSWFQRGADLDGDNFANNFGCAVDLDSLGATLVVGAFGDTVTGYAKVFNWVGNGWLLKGSRINGDRAGDWLGSAAAINATGGTIVLGAFGNDNGYARVLKFDGVDWVRLGNDMIGEAQFDQFGRRVSINSQGNIVSSGTQFNDGNGNDAGHVRVLEYLAPVGGIGQDVIGNSSLVYPNPTQGILFWEHGHETATVQVFSMDGKELISTQLQSPSSIDLGSLAPGVYFLQIRTPSRHETRKVTRL